MRRIAIAILLLAPVSAAAQDFDLTYVAGASVAYGVVGDTDGQTKAGAATKTSFGDVYALTLGAGVVIDARYEIGAEFFYAASETEEVRTGGLTFPLAADISAYGLMANAYYRHPLESGLTPYIGGAIGFAAISNDAGSATVGAATVTLTEEDETVATAAFDLGFDYALNETFSIGPRYRYHWFDRDDLSANLIAIRARYAF